MEETRNDILNELNSALENANFEELSAESPAWCA